MKLLELWKRSLLDLTCWHVSLMAMQWDGFHEIGKAELGRRQCRLANRFKQMWVSAVEYHFSLSSNPFRGCSAAVGHSGGNHTTDLHDLQVTTLVNGTWSQNSNERPLNSTPPAHSNDFVSPNFLHLLILEILKRTVSSLSPGHKYKCREIGN